MVNDNNWILLSQFDKVKDMVKKVIIEVLLVPEAINKSTDTIRSEILREFSKGFLLIPWGQKIEKLKIVEA